jgi:hypothetical protein
MTPFTILPINGDRTELSSPASRAQAEQAFYERHANDTKWFGWLPRSAAWPLAVEFALAVVGIAIFLR